MHAHRPVTLTGIANDDSMHTLGRCMAPNVIYLVLHRPIYDRCPMDFRQVTRGRVLVAQASTGDLVAGRGEPYDTAAIGTLQLLACGVRCWPKKIVRARFRAAVVGIMVVAALLCVYIAPTHFYLTPDQT